MRHWGQRIKAVIKKAGLRQIDVARGINESQQNISNWIKDSSPEIKYIEKICDFIDMKLWEFFIDENEVAKQYKLDPKLIEICHKIEKLNDINQKKFLNLIVSGLALVEKESNPKDD